jgi:predicted DNA-binding protein YlxM (UPF0122 family)
LTLYKKTGKSIRELSKETTISTKSIFQTLKHCKERLKENVGEDYEDYKNKDYELILKKMARRKKQAEGLGDSIEQILEVTGVAKLAKWVMGEDCGCDERKEKLNKLFPYVKPECSIRRRIPIFSMVV